MATKILAAFFALVILLAPNVAMAQMNMSLADTYQLYAVHWNGSLTSGTVVSIAIPAGVAARRATYPVGVQLISTAPVTVAITINSDPHPTTTAVVPVPLNTTMEAEFRGYTSSNAGFGSVVTQEPASQWHSIMLDGVKFPSGLSANRNLNLHVSAASGATGYVTWKVAQK